MTRWCCALFGMPRPTKRIRTGPPCGCGSAQGGGQLLAHHAQDGGVAEAELDELRCVVRGVGPHGVHPAGQLREVPAADGALQRDPRRPSPQERRGGDVVVVQRAAPAALQDMGERRARDGVVEDRGVTRSRDAVPRRGGMHLAPQRRVDVIGLHEDLGAQAHAPQQRARLQHVVGDRVPRRRAGRDLVDALAHDHASRAAANRERTAGHENVSRVYAAPTRAIRARSAGVVQQQLQRLHQLRDPREPDASARCTAVLAQHRRLAVHDGRRARQPGLQHHHPEALEARGVHQHARAGVDRVAVLVGDEAEVQHPVRDLRRRGQVAGPHQRQGRGGRPPGHQLGVCREERRQALRDLAPPRVQDVPGRDPPGAARRR